MKKNKLSNQPAYKKIIAAYEKLILKLLDIDDAGAAMLDVYNNETAKLYNRLYKLTNGENVDSAEDEAIGQAVKNVKKRLKAI